jgi:class 3 adenylate cyclase
MAANPKSAMTEYVEPQWAMVTVLFIDIRGFTTFADRSTARDAVDYLNEFFALVVPVVTRHGGHANKLLGDGLLGVFGAPDPCPDHADRAIVASRDMLDTVDEHFGERCRIGIGINSGLVLVGTVGGGDLHELGLIGDPVNVAARVQNATRELGEPLLLTEATRLLLEREGDRLEPRGDLRLKGKAEPVTVYGLDSRNGFRTPPVYNQGDGSIG